MNKPSPQDSGSRYGATTIIPTSDPRSANSWGRKPTVWLVFAAVAVCFVSAGLGPNLTYKEMRRIKSEIASLPMEERQQLDRNLATFQNMSPAEHRKLRELHENIEARDLMPLVNEYHNWLDTLSPFQRQALRDMDDPAARIALVEKLLSENQESSEQRLAELIAQSDNPHLRMLLRHREEHDFDTIYVLTQDQINTLINDVLIPQLNSTQQQQMQSFTDDERVSRVLRASISTLNNARMSWPTSRTFDMLAEHGIDLQEDSTAPREVFGRTVPYELWQRFAFRRLLVRSLLIAEMREFEAKHPVRENDLLTFFAKLDSSEQAKILDSPADYQTRALKWLYLWETHRDEGLFDREDFLEHVVQQLIPWGDRGRFDRDSRGGDRRGPDGRGPDGRGPEGRGSDDRRGGGERSDRPFPPPGPPPEGPPRDGPPRNPRD